MCGPNKINKMYIKNEFISTATTNGIYIDSDNVGINRSSQA